MESDRGTYGGCRVFQQTSIITIKALKWKRNWVSGPKTWSLPISGKRRHHLILRYFTGCTVVRTMITLIEMMVVVLKCFLK